jgi:hypothetical protein
MLVRQLPVPHRKVIWPRSGMMVMAVLFMPCGSGVDTFQGELVAFLSGLLVAKSGVPSKGGSLVPPCHLRIVY